MKRELFQPPGELTGPWHVKIDARGRFTIPKPICHEFGLRAGDTVLFTLLDGGTISLRFFRKLKTGGWIDLLQRRKVRRLPEEGEESARAPAPLNEGGGGPTNLPAKADPESAVRQAIGNGALAQDKLNWVPGEILREDFVQPLGLTSKTIAQAVVRDRRKAAEFARRLDDFMAHVECDLDLHECLRLDRYFGMSDGFFWRVICSCEVRTGVAEHARELAWIKPLPRPVLPARDPRCGPTARRPIWTWASTPMSRRAFR